MAARATNKKQTTNTKQAKAERTSTALINAARSLLLSEGVAGVSVRRIAEHAGVTTMAVYSQFGGKEGVLTALFDEGFAHLAAAQQAVPRNIKPAERALRLCRAYREVASRYPHHYDLMLGNHSATHVPTIESQQYALATFDILVEAANLHLSRARSGRGRELAESLFALTHGWVMLERIGAIQNKDAAFDAAVIKLLSS
jgi:AcrR family transcriptional regulator